MYRVGLCGCQSNGITTGVDWNKPYGCELWREGLEKYTYLISKRISQEDTVAGQCCPIYRVGEGHLRYHPDLDVNFAISRSYTNDLQKWLCYRVGPRQHETHKYEKEREHQSALEGSTTRHEGIKFPYEQ